MNRESLILVRGAGDLATGTIHRLFRAGFPVMALETARPAAIRRQVSFCEAVYDGRAEVEGLEAVLAKNAEEARMLLKSGKIPVFVDPEGTLIEKLHPDVVVDAVLAKKNLGTRIDMAPLTIALGPGFTAGTDVDLVVETRRGHDLGRIFREGQASPNTGIPGNIGGFTLERVVRAQAEGVFRNLARIGDVVQKGDPIGEVCSEDGEKHPVPATLTGVLRGLLRDGYPVTEGFKLADIDPRKEELANCFTISDKARCIAGSVLEAVCAFFCERTQNQ